MKLSINDSICFHDLTSDALDSLLGGGHLDFKRDFGGSGVNATVIAQSGQDDHEVTMLELFGAEADYALLTNGDTMYFSGTEAEALEWAGLSK